VANVYLAHPRLLAQFIKQTSRNANICSWSGKRSKGVLTATKQVILRTFHLSYDT